jgi:hypothetical protein
MCRRGLSTYGSISGHELVDAIGSALNKFEDIRVPGSISGRELVDVIRTAVLEIILN